MNSFSETGVMAGLRRVPAFLAFLVAVLCPACEDEGICTDDVVSRVRAGFYVRAGSGERDTVLSSLSFFGVGRPDSLLHDGLPGIRRIDFPLPQQADGSTDFVFSTAAGTDTIRVFHDPRQVLLSFPCGFTTVHDILRVEFGGNVIDTIDITGPYVDTEIYENLRIYIWPAVSDTAR
jgi:hypothetical protein